MIEVKIHPLSDENKNYLFVVIAAQHKGKWIWVKHRERDTWEIPGGHIEENENPYDAAIRELVEETGAIKFSVRAICDYSVTINDQTGISRLYVADIDELGELPESEIRCIELFDGIPEKITYPDIQPILLNEVIKGMQQVSSK